MPDLREIVEEGERLLAAVESASLPGYPDIDLADWVDRNLKSLLDAARECAEAREQRDALAAALEKARSILFAYTDNEATAHPWWAIVRNGSFGRMVVLVAPFFSREAAEEHRRARIYEYGEKSFVFCFSGYYAWQYRDLCDSLKAIDPAAILAARDAALIERLAERAKAGGNHATANILLTMRDLAREGKL